MLLIGFIYACNQVTNAFIALFAVISGSFYPFFIFWNRLQRLMHKRGAALSKKGIV